MPQVGEQRKGATETVEWNGSRWTPVTVSPVDPGETSNPWVAGAKGFVRGASEAATPGKLGMLAALLTGGGSIPAQMATAGGAETIAELLQTLTGSPEAPKSFGEGATRVGLAAGTAGAGGAIGKGISKLRNAGGLMDAALEVGSHVPGLKTLSRGAQALRGLAPAAEEGASGYGAAYKPRMASEVPGSIYRDVPSGQAFEPHPVAATPPETPWHPSQMKSGPQMNSAGPASSVPDVPASIQALEPPTDPLEAFASGPRVGRGLGSAGTPEQEALYNRYVSGAKPAENLNAAVNTIAVRPRMSAPAAAAAPRELGPSNVRAYLGAGAEEPTSIAALDLPSEAPYAGYTVNAGGDMPVRPTILNRELPESLGRDILDMDQAYRRHLYDQRAPYRPATR
jgi:hypothetical protein